MMTGNQIYLIISVIEMLIKKLKKNFDRGEKYEKSNRTILH